MRYSKINFGFICLIIFSTYFFSSTATANRKFGGQISVTLVSNNQSEYTVSRQIKAELNTAFSFLFVIPKKSQVAIVEKNIVFNRSNENCAKFVFKITEWSYKSFTSDIALYECNNDNFESIESLTFKGILDSKSRLTLVKDSIKYIVEYNIDLVFNESDIEFIKERFERQNSITKE